MVGITPAPAGKTYFAYRLQKQDEDHPRTCGENFYRKTSPTLHLGSPPHLRGKLLENLTREKYIGITPAPAGKTLYIWSELLQSEDHPRTCGENPLTFFIVILPSRITPAPAGKTNKFQASTELNWDHPRTCGENCRI